MVPGLISRDHRYINVFIVLHVRSQERNRETDRQTQTNRYDWYSNTAFCTKVHRSIDHSISMAS